ncbi:thioredoxin domain-containing protein [Brasilonema sp. CT11]|nr:thioredoxin domain-containing protein [Brasilonema sp. CT11]
MSIWSNFCPSRFLRQAVRAGFLALCIVWLSLSTPVQAATNTSQADSNNLINPKLEAEVLQIIHNHPEVVVEALQAYQQQQQKQQQQAKQLVLQEIKTNPNKIIGESPTTGATEPKILLIEFSDFQCPYCAKAHKTLKQFMARHQDEVTLAYKHFPLISIHSEAMPAAKAAWAAQQQGKFWQYQDALFSSQGKLGEKLYVAIAKKLNLDLEQFNQQRSGNAADAVIQKDIETAMRLGIQGTPFFVMNEETFDGAVELSDIERILARTGNREQGTGNREQGTGNTTTDN